MLAASFVWSRCFVLFVARVDFPFLEDGLNPHGQSFLLVFGLLEFEQQIVNDLLCLDR